MLNVVDDEYDEVVWLFELINGWQLLNFGVIDDNDWVF